MNNQLESRILLADGRGITEYQGLCSHHVFNFGNFAKTGRETFGGLIAFNDDLLGSEISTEFVVSSDMEIYLIPVVGGIEINLDGDNRNVYALAGECYNMKVTRGARVRITNPYPKNAVNFIQIWLDAVRTHFIIPTAVKRHFESQIDNRLFQIFKSLSGTVKGYIGKYFLRSKDSFRVQKPRKNIFVYVIEGAFEFQDRLIQTKDGLRFENISTDLDFEALSPGAILLILETDR